VVAAGLFPELFFGLDVLLEDDLPALHRRTR
jgi:hypothetical protein